MPELPEVERGRQLAERVARGRRIVAVEAAADDIVFDGVESAEVEHRLQERVVSAVHRRGKQLWLELDRPPHLLVHFGMTGAFRVADEAPLPLASSPRGPDPGWPPRFTKLWLRFDDGGELVAVNKRRLGRIRFRDDPEGESPIRDLGFDPLLDLPSPRRFLELVRRRSVTLKGLLLDQGFAAGVGNWIADEVLYQARLDPRRSAASLSDQEARRLRTKLRHVIRFAVSVDADKERFPRTWLFHHRWGREADARTGRGEAIQHIRVAGRTTAWVPDVQG